MDSAQIELLGYAASVLIAISLSLKSIRNLRLVNLAGAIGFVAYGLMIQSYPIVILNAYLCIVNLYRVMSLTKT